MHWHLSIDALLSKKMFVTPAAGTVQIGGTLQFTGTHGTAPFQFQVADASVGTISANGLFSASKAGSTNVTVTDAGGQSSQSLEIRVVEKGASQPTNPGNPGMPGGEDCPLGDMQLCDAICGIQPDLPFCKKP